MELYIYCSECNHDKQLTQEILTRLGIDGTTEVSPDDINTEKLKCSECSSKNSIIVRSKTCIQCGKRISSGRLNAFPNANRCVECQNNPQDTCEDSVDYGDDDIGNCPRCGSELVWRERGRDNPLWNFRGSRYFLGCPNFPRCR